MSSLGRTFNLALLCWTCAIVVGAAGDSDPRYVSARDLRRDMVVYSGDGDESDYFSEMLFDPEHSQVVVGARDAVFRLSLDGLARLEKAAWPADETKVALCQAKGQDEDACRNYIRVLLKSKGDSILVCGTHAFSPKCSWRKAERMSHAEAFTDGRAICPHNPLDNVTSLMSASSGDLYVGASTDFSGNDDAIYRMSYKDRRWNDLVRTSQYNVLWLDKPDFVASFETEEYVYFLLRETAVEHSNCGKAVYSRMARVCKDDSGRGLGTKGTFTTFLKARLNCSLPGEYPFYYDEIQSAQFLPESKLVYAAFTTTTSSIR